MYIKIEKSKNDFSFIDITNKEEIILGKDENINLGITGKIIFWKLIIFGISKKFQSKKLNMELKNFQLNMPINSNLSIQISINPVFSRHITY